MSVKHRLVLWKPRNVMSLPFKINLGPMKLWHAIGVQLLSIALREQARWGELEREKPVQVSCNCTGAIESSRGSASDHPHTHWLTCGLVIGILLGVVITWLATHRLASRDNGQPVGRGPRRRGGGVLSINSPRA